MGCHELIDESSNLMRIIPSNSGENILTSDFFNEKSYAYLLLRSETRYIYPGLGCVELNYIIFKKSQIQIDESPKKIGG